MVNINRYVNEKLPISLLSQNEQAGYSFLWRPHDLHNSQDINVMQHHDTVRRL